MKPPLAAGRWKAFFIGVTTPSPRVATKVARKSVRRAWPLSPPAWSPDGTKIAYVRYQPAMK